MSSAMCDLLSPDTGIEIVRQRRQRFQAVRSEIDEILQPDAPPGWSPLGGGLVEARLDGEDVSRAQDPLAAGGLLEGGEFVEVEADAVAEVVDVAARRPR